MHNTYLSRPFSPFAFKRDNSSNRSSTFDNHQSRIQNFHESQIINNRPNSKTPDHVKFENRDNSRGLSRDRSEQAIKFRNQMVLADFHEIDLKKNLVKIINDRQRHIGFD